MHKLVLLRHGQSTWNLENRFTGWTDVDLSEQGTAEATEAGRLLREGNYQFDLGLHFRPEAGDPYHVDHNGRDRPDVAAGDTRLASE